MNGFSRLSLGSGTCLVSGGSCWPGWCFFRAWREEVLYLVSWYKLGCTHLKLLWFCFCSCRVEVAIYLYISLRTYPHVLYSPCVPSYSGGYRHPMILTRSRDSPVGSYGVFFFLGEEFPCPRACGFFLLVPLLGHGICQLVNMGLLLTQWCNGAV